MCGLINVQFAVKDGQVYVLEANPRASRTVPFVAKATGVPLAMVAARVMVGQTLADLRQEGLLRARRHRPGAGARPREREGGGAALRPLPRRRHPARPRDALDRRGHGRRHHLRPGLRQEPDGGRDAAARRRDRLPLARRPGQAGRPGGGAAPSASSASPSRRRSGTAGYLRSEGLVVDTLVAKVGEEGVASDAVELIAQGKVQLVVNTPRGLGPRADGQHIRTASVVHKVPCLTTLAAARAAAAGIADARSHPLAGAGAPGSPPGPRGRRRSESRSRRRAGRPRSPRPSGAVASRQPGDDRVGHVRPRHRARRRTARWATSAPSWSSRSRSSRGPATRRRGCTRSAPACSTASGLQGPGLAAWVSRRSAGAGRGRAPASS